MRQIFKSGRNAVVFLETHISASLQKIIKIYQKLTSFSGTCRFSPTCSEYTRQAIAKHGTIKGLWMGAKRVLRCNPFFVGGVDIVK